MKNTRIARFVFSSIIGVSASCGIAPLSMASTEKFDGYTIETIENCMTGLDEAKGNALVLFNGHKNALSGWSHVKKSAEYKSLHLPVEDYAIGAANSQADNSCQGANTFQAVLVKKYADWDRQHSNGIEPHFRSEKISFGKVESIVFELKINSAKTFIPDSAKIKAVYGSYIKSDEELNSWDAGKVNFGITLFEEGWEEQDNPSFTAARFVEIDQAKYADKWLRVTIKSDQLNYFNEKNWGQIPAELADYVNNPILGLRINPETRSGKVVRHFVKEFNDTIPETFKEIGISIRRLEIRLK